MRRRDIYALLLASALPLPAAVAQAQLAPAQAAPAQPGWEAMLRLAVRLRQLDGDGLAPRFYDIPADARAASDPNGYVAALYAAALAAMTDLVHGRVIDLPGRPDLRRDLGRFPMTPWQATLYASAEPAEVIEKAALQHPDMPALRLALRSAQARVEAGGFPTIPPGGTLDPGMTDAVRIPALRARLAAEDPVLAAAPDGGELYDDVLLEAVRRWQTANWLEPDGRVGPATQALLNRPAQLRVGQLRVAMDMRRGAARPPAGRRIEVNIPDYRLRVLDGQRTLLQMNVVVGKPARATPPLVVRMTAVQFNPPWGVPVRNATQDLLPRFRRDTRAMMEKGFRVFGTVGGERVEIDPTTIDWSSVNENSFPYFIRQDAGDSSALGRLKFIMPNGEDIYLHDTPDRHLFSRTDRAFSSGCVRLGEPMALLELVLQDIPGWDRARADRTLDSRQTSQISLRNPIPVRLAYETVTVAEGEVRVRPDIYGLDATYLRVMDQRRPVAPPMAPAMAAAPAGRTAAAVAPARTPAAARPVPVRGDAPQAALATPPVAVQ